MPTTIRLLDFNPVIDNHGAAQRHCPGATARISSATPPRPTPPRCARCERGGGPRRDGGDQERDGFPPELPADHPLIRRCAALTGETPLTAPYGTDAAELQAIAPCVVLGPGDIAEAHTPTEKANVAALAAAVPLFMRLAEQVAADR